MPSLKDAATSSNNQSNNSYATKRKETLGFANATLPNGRKLGFMSINEDFAQIHERLMEDPALLAKFISNITWDYRPNVKADTTISDDQLDSLFG